MVLPVGEVSVEVTKDGESVSSGADLGISVDAPPQLARHEGYETAVFEMGDASVTL